MLAHFFVFRPVFAAVLAICIMAAGILALLTLPVEQYPDIAPPGVTVTANYPGAVSKNGGRQHNSGNRAANQRD